MLYCDERVDTDMVSLTWQDTNKAVERGLSYGIRLCSMLCHEEGSLNWFWRTVQPISKQPAANAVGEWIIVEHLCTCVLPL